MKEISEGHMYKIIIDLFFFFSYLQIRNLDVNHVQMMR